MINSISLFNVALQGTTTYFADVNKLSIPLGYIVEPEACTEETLSYFKDQTADFNSTFYKEWKEVQSKTKEDILFDQIRHYSSTYGTNFEGEAWTPNDGERPLFDYSNYKVIKAVSEQELFEKCDILAKSGIALSKEVIDYIVGIYSHIKPNLTELEIIAYPNKELKAALYAANDILPIDCFDLLRYIAIKATGNAMIIQNKETFALCKNRFDFSKLDEKRLISLSSIFLRYKNFILAFKDDTPTANNHAINRLRRLAKKYHKPLAQGFWETVLAEQPNLTTCLDNLNSLSVWKSIKIIQACRERGLSPKTAGYLVRNQKMFTKEAKSVSVKESFYYKNLAKFLIEDLKARISDKKVRLPKNFRLAVPSSEKSFVGNLPLGSCYSFDNTGYVGIYWRGEWGTRDFDLHFINEHGAHICWNTGAYNQDGVMFSGDMTRADPEASEVMSFQRGCPSGIIEVARFHGNVRSRFDIICGSQEEIPERAVIDPTTIKFRASCVSDSREKSVGHVYDNKLVLMSFRNGDQRIPSGSTIEVLRQKAQSFVYLDELITNVPDDYDGDDLIDLSSEEFSKDDVIKIFS